MGRVWMRRLRQNNSGATIIEFAIIAPIFFLLMFATIQFGLYLFTYVTIESAITQSARTASINSGIQPDMVAFIREDIKKRVKNIPTKEQVVITSTRVGEGQNLPPDICDTNGTITMDCSCFPAYVEMNKMGGCQPAGEIENYAGANDVIEVRASVPWKVTMPLISRLFVSSPDADGHTRTGYAMISASAVVKNEPQGGGGSPPPDSTDGECCTQMPLNNYCDDYPDSAYCGWSPCTNPNGCGPQG